VAAWNNQAEFVSLKAAPGMMQKRTAAPDVILAPWKQGCISLTEENKVRI